MSNEFSKRIKAARKKLGIKSYRQLAKQWGFSPSTIHCWKTGRRNPAGLYLDKLEAVLKEVESG